MSKPKRNNNAATGEIVARREPRWAARRAPRSLSNPRLALMPLRRHAYRRGPSAVLLRIPCLFLLARFGGFSHVHARFDV